MNQKLKKCSDCGELKRLFGHGRCTFCYKKHKAQTTKPKPKVAIKKKHVPTGEKELFEKIWNTRPRVCYVSKDRLLEPQASIFSHVLSKAANKYYKYKLNPENIVLLRPDLHLLYDFGTEEQRQKTGYTEGWQRLYELRDKLKEQYKSENG